ncbi:MAG: non-canonical purine NTP pyrophosphatase, partial [Bacteroidales bacterium]|nr:non-canonical purine NTP pyrophosphatase [Bacteroidales bacterium]
MSQIIFATNNLHKLSEIRQIVPVNIHIVSLSDIGFVQDIPETSDSIAGNALQKAWYIHDIYKANCFADDTGLEVEALGGEPGVYSARYAGPGCT